ncbi:MAG: general secretion pathway protein B [Paraglaciecola sp.]|jgi:general secretion pathway protein B
MLRQIDIQDLQPGMVIVRVTEQNGPVKIKKSGLVTSQGMVQGLSEMGIQKLEIDPDQTVEVEAPAIKKSATLRMLESNKVTNTQIDDSLSEQFHRSLFLPSVQDIPSAWQFYTKRYFLAAFIALGGLSVGWTLANYQEIMTLLSPKPNKLLVNVSVPVSTTVAPATQLLDNKIEPSIKVDIPQDRNTGLNVNQAAQQVAAIDDIGISLETIGVSQAGEPAPEPAPLISANLLKSFQKAMAETEDLPVMEKPIKNISSSKDVPRIDQLPAWVMNRLPSMAFSAHMYASIEAERWVRVNGTRMVEGDKIDGKIEIVRIEPQHVILNYSGQMFSMSALTDW